MYIKTSLLGKINPEGGVFLVEDDTIKLLQECNAGIKMGVTSLNDVLDHVSDAHMRDILQESKKVHEKLGNETHKYLNEYHDQGKEPAVTAKMMSWMKTNAKLGGEESDRTVADLITDGCNMGVKSLYRYLHQYPTASASVQKLAEKVIAEEEHMIKEMREYL